jgi:hypothetical protein
MIISTTISQLIDKHLKIDDDLRKEEHISSGKLSAGMLGEPIQWMVLKYLGVPTKGFDSYTLRKFKRGRDVEDFVIKELEFERNTVLASQKLVEYRDVVGYLDCLAFGTEFDCKIEKLPIEIKSVTNADFKWITKGMEAKRGHILQAGLYGLALSLPYFSVLYVASDDYRTLHFIYETNSVVKEINEIIDKYNQCLQYEVIPDFEGEGWQKSEKYNKYPEFMNLTGPELSAKAQELFNKKKGR